MVNEQAQLLALVSNEKLEKVDAIICLEGDEDFIRADKSFEIFNKQLSPVIIVLGKKEVENYLINKKGLKISDIVFVQGPHKKEQRNTLTEAEEIAKKIKQENWRSIILVTSTFHQPRAFLTFLGLFKRNGLLGQVKIFNAPTNHPWFSVMDTKDNQSKLTRWELFFEEFKKIKQYREKENPPASLQEAIEYQQWKEQQ